MAAPASTGGLWSLILTTSLTLTGCMGANTEKETYTVGSVLLEPFLMEQEEGHMGADAKYEGFIPDLLHAISDHRLSPSVDFKIRIQPDGKFGTKTANLQWDGLVGSLTRREIDLAAGPLTITSMRDRVIDFSKPFMSSGLRMVISDRLRDGSPPPSTSRVGLVLKPFTPMAWLMLIAAVLMIAVFAVIVHCLNPQGERKGHMGSVSQRLTTCSGGGEYSGCVLRTTMLLFVLLTVVLYTAGVVSLLLYNTRVENAQLLQQQQQTDYEHMNLTEVVDSRQYKFAVASDSATRTFLRTSKTAVYERIYAMLTFVENDTAGFDLVLKDPGYAFITDRALIEYYISRKPYCGLNIIGPMFTANGYGLGYPHYSEVRERIDLAILEMQESGQLEGLRKKWWNDRAQCNKPTVPSKKQPIPASPGIDSTTIGGVLIILAIGLLLAVGVRIIERFRLRSSKANVREGPRVI